MVHASRSRDQTDIRSVPIADCILGRVAFLLSNGLEFQHIGFQVSISIITQKIFMLIATPREGCDSLLCPMVTELGEVASSIIMST